MIRRKTEKLNMENKEIETIDESVEDILRSSITELAVKNKGVYDLLINKARDGFFEVDQTRGALKKLAIQLLNVQEECERRNED